MCTNLVSELKITYAPSGIRKRPYEKFYNQNRDILKKHLDKNEARLDVENCLSANEKLLRGPASSLALVPLFNRCGISQSSPF